MSQPERRTVVRDSGFEASFYGILQEWAEVERFIAAAEIVLSLDPEIGSEIGDGVWALPMAPLRGADIWLYYTFYEKVVVLYSVVAFAE